MSDILVTAPHQPFTLPNQFKAVFNGFIYCGTVDAVDPSVSQVQVYLVNEDGSKVPVPQPLRTNAGGFLVYNGQPARFVTDSNHSLLVQDAQQVQVWYEPNMAISDPSSLWDLITADDGAKWVGYIQLGAGAVPRPSLDKMREVFSVDDFGAVGTGLVDDSPAVALAIAAAPNGGCISFTANKTYSLNGVSLSGKSLTILAHGATIKGPAGVRVPGYFDFTGAGDIKIVGATVDLMHGAIPAYVPADYPNEYNRLFYGTGATSITIESCNIKNLYNTVISAVQVGTTRIIGNTFASAPQNQTQVLDYIRCTTCADVVVEGNFFNSATPTSAAFGTCAVFASGITGSVTVRGNKFKNCGRDNTGAHRLGVVDFYFDVKNINVSDNIADDCWAQFSRVSSCATGKIVNNIISVNGAAEALYTLLSVESVMIGAAGRACSDILIEGNTFNDPANRHEAHVGIYAYDWGLPSKEIRVINNKFNGAKKMVSLVGPYSNVTISDNMVDGYIGKISVSPQETPTLTSNQGTEANSIMDGLVIRGNKIRDTGSAVVTIDVNITKAPEYTGTFGDIEVTENTITNATSAGVYGININGSANKTGKVVLNNNRVKGYTMARRVTRVGQLEDTYNKASNGGGLDSSNNTWVMRRFNSDFGGTISGLATLVAGVVTVPSAEIKSTDVIALTVAQTSGTIGTLFIDSKTPNSNFVIKSTSGTDGSTILWEIQHVV